MRKDIEKEIERLMSKNPDYTYEEAKELAEYDLEVDKMDMSEVLTKEEKKLIKSLTKADKKIDAPKEKKVVVRKENTDKRYIVDVINKALENDGLTPTVSNVEKTIEFTYNGIDYTVSLIAHRHKKS